MKSINKFSLLSIGLALSLLTACSYQPYQAANKSLGMNSQLAANNAHQQLVANEPSWLYQPPNRAGFAYGIGSNDIYGSVATAINLAKDQAKADLLASFRVEIDSTTNVNQSLSSNANNFNLQKNINQQILSRIPKIELSGIQIKETWITADKKTAWALAELNTNEAELKLLTELEQLDKQLLARGSLNSGDKLARINYLKPSFIQLAKRKQILEQLDFLGASSKLDASQQQKVEELERQVSQLLASLGIKLEATNNAAKNLLPKLNESLTSLGFNLVNRNEDLLLKVNLTSSSINNQGLTHLNATASSEISAKGRILHALTSQTKAVSSRPQVALTSAENNLASQLATSLVESLYQNL